jgi:hypothetical protein
MTNGKSLNQLKIYLLKIYILASDIWRYCYSCKVININNVKRDSFRFFLAFETGDSFNDLSNQIYVSDSPLFIRSYEKHRSTSVL